jgi:hypothetical protein
MEIFTVAAKLEVLAGTWSLGGSLLPNTSHGGVVEAARVSLRYLIWVPSTINGQLRQEIVSGDWRRKTLVRGTSFRTVFGNIEDLK